MAVDIDKVLADVEAEAAGLGEKNLAQAIGQLREARSSGNLEENTDVLSPGTTDGANLSSPVSPDGQDLPGAPQEDMNSEQQIEGQEDGSAGQPADGVGGDGDTGA